MTQANGGTVLLDEVGELPLSAQKSFLRTLQERCVRPLGGKKEIPVDIRLISATNLDLDQMVKNSQFRQDLLYRIRVVEIRLPPLRERLEDIEEIATKKLKELFKHYHIETKTTSAEFFTALAACEWRGNIRELINVLEYALASAGSDPTLFPKHLPPEYRMKSIEFAPCEESNIGPPNHLNFQALSVLPTLIDLRNRVEREYLVELIHRAEGDRKKASKISGMSQSRLYALLNKHQLPGFGTS